MPNNPLNVGDNPDHGIVRRSCVVPHKLTFGETVSEPNDRLADDSVKVEIKSNRHLPVLWHIIVSLYPSLTLVRGTQVGPRPSAVVEATAAATQSLTKEKMQDTLLCLVTYTKKAIDASDHGDIKAVLKHVCQASDQ